MEISTHTHTQSHTPHTHTHSKTYTHTHYYIVPLIDIIWTISIYHCFPLHCCVLIRTLVCRSYLLSAKVKEKMSSCSMYQYATFFRSFSFYGSVLLLRMFLYGFSLRFFLRICCRECLCFRTDCFCYAWPMWFTSIFFYNLKYK